MATNTKNTQAFTPEDTLWMYPHIFEPYSFNNEGAGKYTVKLLIDANNKDAVAALEAAQKAAYEVGQDKLKGNRKVVPSYESIRHAVIYGDEMDTTDPIYENKIVINAKSNTKPGICDREGVDITNPNEVYSGCYGMAAINFYAYNAAGSCGIAASLDGLLKCADGERLGGAGSAKALFNDFITPAQDEGAAG